MTYNVLDGNLLEVCATLFQPTEGGAAVLENPVQVTVTSSNIDAIGMPPLLSTSPQRWQKHAKVWGPLPKVVQRCEVPINLRGAWEMFFGFTFQLAGLALVAPIAIAMCFAPATSHHCHHH